MSSASPASGLSPASTAIPVCEFLLSSNRTLHAKGRPWATLLAVCPNSDAVLRASVLAAKRAGAPMLLAATLNQVDLDGGYTGWNHSDLVQRVEALKQHYGFAGPVAVCMDHGGPWLRDKHTTENWPLNRSMAWVKASMIEALEAGYALLHVDPTVDRTLPPDQPMPIDSVVERTLELIEHVETYRHLRGLPPISYEVGTEEVHGGLADMHTFRRFLSGLKDGLAKRGLSHAWPCFVVGKVGTDLHTTEFDPRVAEQLFAELEPFGSVVKGHYSDFVSNPEAYPAARMGGANVGPEFTEIEYEALMELEAREAACVTDPAARSGLSLALREAVLGSGRWKKWLLPGEAGQAFDALPDERQAWLVRTGCRYIWTAHPVQEARRRLATNLQPHGVDSEQVVTDRIADRIAKYLRVFHLEGFALETLREFDS